MDVVEIVYTELLKVVGGAAIVLAALSAFIGRIWINRIANAESKKRDEAIARLKGEIDKQAAELKARLDVTVQKTVLVDKMQFEHEYEIYKLAWEKLFALQQATLQLRPTLDYIDPKESKEERMQKRVGNLLVPYNGYSALIETNKPFYPESVYKALIAVRDKCHEEVFDYEFIERSPSEYWKEARENHAEIQRLIDNACLAIRNRIAEVRVAEG